MTLIALLLVAWTLAPAASEGAPSVQRVVSMQYPMLARMAWLQGTVRLRAWVSPAGVPEKVAVISGPEPLATPATADLRQWRFTGCDSSSITCTVEIDFSFVLDGTCSDSPRCPTEFQVDLPNRVIFKSQVFGRILPGATSGGN
jgi:hypothetical protein